LERGRARFFARPGTNRIHRLVFSLDGRSLAAADNAKPLSQMAAGNERSTVRVWNVDAGKETHVFSTEDVFPLSLTFSADGRALLGGSAKGEIKVWSLAGPGGTTTFLARSGATGGLALLPDGRTLITAGPDIRFWDVAARRETDTLDPRGGAYHRLALSPDGRRFAAGASDGRITIWDIASHQEVATLEGDQESVHQLAFTPDGDHLVSANQHQVRIWRAAAASEADSPMNPIRPAKRR